VLEVMTPTEVRLTISEGRYHQVKRMFAAVGNHVVGLHRERIGDIMLDESLAPGEYRPLTEEEIASVGLRMRGVKRDGKAEFFTGDCVYSWPAGHVDAAVD
jgi:16S rRNA U516 pseudouridylate synthase RsuA-like enzyme